MGNVVLELDDVSKQYQLGQIGTGTLSHDLNRWWSKIRGKEDPYSTVGDVNDRTIEGGDYVWALRNINFKVNKGDIIGVIGRNGAGKSTLLKLLSQITGPTTGHIKSRGRIASLLEVGTGFHPELTGRENIFLNGAIMGMTKKEIVSKLNDIIEFSGCAKYVDTPVKRYSSGMKVRLGFAVAAHLESEILIVDEVLAVGDADFQKKAISKMKQISTGEGRTILFVSHNMGAIKSLCKSGIIMDKGTVVKSGNIDDVVREYLKGEMEESSFGIIPKKFPRNSYHKDKLRIESIVLKNSKRERIENLLYLEKCTIESKIVSYEDISNVVVFCSFMNIESLRISYSASNDSPEQTLVKLEKGENVINIDIEQRLLPGNYNVGISILSEDGYPYESINYFGELTVSNYNLFDEKYKWAKSIGLVNFKSNYNINHEN